MPLTRTPGRSGSRRRLPPAAVLIPLAALLVGCAAAAAPHAHADGHQLTVEISTKVASPTDMQNVTFTAKFSKPVNASTLDASDFNVTSGDVVNLRGQWSHNATIGGAGPGQLNQPLGVAVDDSSGTIYVTSKGNNVVRVFNSDLRPIANISASGNSLAGVGVDGSGNVYLPDKINERVRVFNSSLSETVAITASDGPTPVLIPVDVAVDDSGIIYVAGEGYIRVGAYYQNRTYIADLPGWFSTPSGVAVDGSGKKVYVANKGNSTVQIFDLPPDKGGPYVTWINYNGLPIPIFDPNTTSVTTLAGPFVRPGGVAVDSAGNVYVAHRGNADFDVPGAGSIVAFDPAGNLTADIRLPFNIPSAVEVDGSGRMYVADRGSHRVHIFDYAYEFDVAGPAAGQLEVFLPAGSVRDGAGNGNAASNTASIRISGATPTITSTQPSPASAETINFQVEFGRPVTGFNGSDIAISGNASHGGVENFAPASAESYSFDVSPVSDGTILVDIPAGAAQDLAGRNSTESARFSMTYYVPTGTTVSSTQPDPTGAGTIDFQVEFGEPVTGFAREDVAISGNATHGGVENFAGGGASYSFDVSPVSDGTILVDVPAGAAETPYGRNSAAAERFSITYDGPPTPIITATQSSPTGESTISFQVEFGEPVTGFNGSDIVLSGNAARGGVENFANASAESYSFDVTLATDGALLVDIPAGAAHDGGGIANLAAERFSIVRESIPAAAITATRSGLTNASTIGFQVEFGDRVEGFNASGITLSGTASHGGVEKFAGANASYSFDVTLATDGALLVDIPAGAAHDADGNANLAAERFSIVRDGTPPAPEFAAAQPGPTSLAAVPFDLTFNGRINGATFDASDIGITSGNVENLTAAWLGDSTIGSQGTGIGQLNSPTGVAVDSAGNAYVADPSLRRVSVFDKAGQHAGDIDYQFSGPRGVETGGPSGLIYVADTDDNRVVIFDAELQNVANITYPFDRPYDVAVDPAGRVYVADTHNGDVRVFDADQQYVGEIVYPFFTPNAVAADLAGNVYVADTNNQRVAVFDSAWRLVVEVSGAGYARGVAVDSAGNIYASDLAGGGRVRVFDPAGNHAGDLPGPFGSPYAVAVDGSDAVYVADTHNDHIAVFDPGYEFVVAGPADGQVLDVSMQAGRVRDAAGNGNAESNAASIRIDRTAPAPNVTSAQPDPTGAATIAFEVDFGEPVDGFAREDVVLTGTASHGGVENLAPASATAYSFDVSPVSDGTILVDIPANATEDKAGNGNEAAERFSITRNSTLLTPTVTAAQPDPTNATTISFQVDFTRHVTGFNAGDIALSGTADRGGVEKFANASAESYSFDVSPVSDGTILVDIPAGAAQDAVTGSDSIAAGQFSIEYDGTPPAPTIAAAQQSPTGAPTIRFAVNFNETVTGFAREDVVLSGNATHGGVENFAPASAESYSFDVSPVSDGTILVDIPANATEDKAGNGNEAAERFSITHESRVPVPTVASTQPSPTGAGTIDFQVEFGEAVTGFNGSDIAISGTATHGGVENFAGGGASYSFAVSPVSDGTILVDVPADAAQDLAGKNSTKSARFSMTYYAPTSTTVASTQPSPTSAGTIDFQVEFGEAVDGFVKNDVAISGTATHGGVENFAGGGASYSFDVSPVSDGTILVDVPAGAAETPYGRNSAAAERFSITYDGPPTPIITATQSSPTGESTISFQVEFGEPVTGFNGSDIVLSGNAARGGVENFANASAESYSFDVTLATDGALLVDIPAGAAHDGGGIANLAAERFSIVRESIPAAAITATRSGLTNASTIGFQVEFGDRVEGFNASGITLSGTASHGGVEKFAGANASYSFDVTLATDGALLVDIPAGAAHDADGNANLAAERFSIVRDGTPPAPEFAAAQPGPTSLAAVPFDLTFNGRINGATFDASDIGITSGNVENLTAAWLGDSTIGSQGTGIGQLNSPTGVAVDSAGNAYVADPSLRRVSVFDKAGQHAGDIDYQFSGPRGVETGGPSGLIYVADTDDNRVVIFDAELQNVANITYPFDRPYDVAVDPAGRVYVADTHNGDVRVFDADQQYVGEIVYPFFTPNAVAADLAGNVYVADTNNQRVAVFDSAWRLVVEVSGAGYARGVAVDSAGNIYASDLAGGGRVRVFDPAGNHAGDLPGPFGSPYAVAVDGSDAVYVADTHNDHIAVFDPGYEFVVAGPADGQVLDVSMQAGRVRDAAGNGNAESNAASIRIDRTAPAPNVTSAQPDPTGAATIAFEVDFGEPVDGFAREDVVLTGTASHGGVENLAPASATAYSFDVSPVSDGTILVDIPANATEDKAGNGNEAAERFSITRNSTLLTPTVTAAQPDPTNATTISFQVDFTRHVTGFNAGDIALSGTADRGGVEKFANASAESYSFDVSPVSDGTILVDIPAGAAQDAVTGSDSIAAGQFSIEYDGTPPAPTIAAAQQSPTGAPTIRFAVNFNETVTGFAREDVVLSGNATHGGVENFAPASAESYSFDVSPVSDGTILVDIPANATEDKAGNGNEAAERFSITHESRVPVPTVASTQPSPTGAGTIDFQVEFGEAVTGFNGSDIAISGTATHGGVENFAGGGASYSFAVSPVSDGTILVDVPADAAQDLAGKNSTKSARFSMTYYAPTSTTVASTQPSPTSAGTIDFQVEFGEAVDGFVKNDVAISGTATHGGVENFAGGGASYSFDVSPVSDGTILVDVPAGAAETPYGRGSAAAERFSMTYYAPTSTTVSSTLSSPTGAGTIDFQVEFGEAVDGFVKNDVAISGTATHGGVENFAGGGASYSFDVSPTSDGTILVDVPAGAAETPYGRGSAAAERFSMTYYAPTGTTVSSTLSSPTVEAPIGFRVEFGEPVTGFAREDVAISGTALHNGVENFAGGGASYSFDVTPVSDGTILVDIPAGAAETPYGRGSAAAERFSMTYYAPTSTTVSSTLSSPTGAGTIDFQVEFGEAVDGFVKNDVAISGTATHGGVENFAGGGASYSFDVSPTSDGTILVDVPAGAAETPYGRGSAAAERFSMTYYAPTGTTVSSTLSSPTVEAPIGFRVEFGEPVTGFAREDVAISGTALHNGVENFAGGGASYSFDVTPVSDGTILVDIPAGAAETPYGRGSAAAERFSIEYRARASTAPAILLEAASLDLGAGANGRLSLAFDGPATAPDVSSFSGEITVRGAGGAAVALSAADVPSIASGRTGDAAFALDISGAKRVRLNAEDLGQATVSLPAGFVSGLGGGPHAGDQPAALAYAQDPEPPRLAAAALNLARGEGRLVLTFDQAVEIPGARSFGGEIVISGRSGGGDAAVSLPAADVMSVESGSAGDRTFVLLVSDRARSLLGEAAFSDPESTSVSLPAGFATNGRSAHGPERAPLETARDSGRPSLLLAFVLNGSSAAAVYSEPVLAVPSHYANITVDGAAVAGNGGASEAAAYGNNVVISWNADAGAAAASAGSAVGFDLSANVTDAFGNPVENPGEKSTGVREGTGLAGKRPARVGAFSGGPGDPSADAARLGAAAFNAASVERGYSFYVDVSEHALPAGASGAAAEAALRGAHAAGEGPLLYVGPASDIALAGMAGYAEENGITVISHSSAARSLAVGGDRIFRMEPGAAHLARALATEVALGGHAAVVPVVQAGLRGPDYGLLESLGSDLEPLGIQFSAPVEFREGGAAAAPVGAAVAGAAGSRGAGSVAVVYVGSDAELAALAGGVPPGSPAREAAWFAPGGAGAGAGDGVAASPAILADAAAVQLARDTRLSAVQFAVERNGITDYIDGIAAPRGPATSATPAYAAYEAVRALGGALVPAGGDPSLAGGNVAGAAALAGGPLGRTGMDGSGDLRFPVTYGIWSVSGVSAEWERAPDLLRGLDACGIDLEKSALALPELSPGSTSRPVRQTVANIGTGPMPAVSVSATDWTQFRGGDPIPGQLPFSYTEMAVGLDGASPRRADSTPLAAGTEIPGGTPPGGSVDVDFRINLEGLEVLRADSISQTVTFVANCG